MNFDEKYLARLRQGDRETAKHLNRHFGRLIRLKIWGRVKRGREEIFVNKVLATALEGIQRGAPDTAECLANYVCGICSGLLNSERGGEAAKIRPQTRVTREQLRLVLARQT
jgi:hypothetical protein